MNRSRLCAYVRDVLAGIGQTFDPEPRDTRRLFEPTDEAANRADWEALIRDHQRDQ